MSLTLYRQCKLGETLSETVNDMVKNDKVTETLGEKILEAFDKVKCRFYYIFI